MPDRKERILSLLPSATEILCRLGLRERLVGISHECDFPAEVHGLPILTRPKLDSRSTSSEIDQSVEVLLQQGSGIYELDEQLLISLKPDLVITQDQCDVCAIPAEEVMLACSHMGDDTPEILSLSPERVGDILDDIPRVAEAAGGDHAGKELHLQLKERLDSLKLRVQRVRSRPRVICIEWIEPLMVAGNWVPELVEIGGGGYALIDAGEQSRRSNWQEIREYDPQVIIIAPCGFPIEQTQCELELLSNSADWHTLEAVRNGRVYVVDGNAYLNRPGPRIVDSAELIAGLVQPGFFASKIPSDSYRRLDSLTR